jgi:MarR family transcriptional regulator, transcriptional regulator for hemolysin
MPKAPVEREIGFNISDVARLLRTYVNQRAREYGMTRAQWAALVRVERSEGLKQTELAEILDLQPITLTRLVDRLCDSGLMERRADPDDRRAKRLYLTPAAQPVLEAMSRLGRDIMETVLTGLEPAARELLAAHLQTMKSNLRDVIANRADEVAVEQSHG